MVKKFCLGETTGKSSIINNEQLIITSSYKEEDWLKGFFFFSWLIGYGV